MKHSTKLLFISIIIKGAKNFKYEPIFRKILDIYILCFFNILFAAEFLYNKNVFLLSKLTLDPCLTFEF